MAAIDTTRSGPLTRHEGNWLPLANDFCEKIRLLKREEEVRDKVEAAQQAMDAIEMTVLGSACCLGTVLANVRIE